MVIEVVLLWLRIWFRLIWVVHFWSFIFKFPVPVIICVVIDLLVLAFELLECVESLRMKE